MSVQAFDVVIFGGGGDLASRKLLPALYRCESTLAPKTRIILTVHREQSAREFLAGSISKMTAFLSDHECDAATLKRFRQRLHMLVIDVDGERGWGELTERLSPHTKITLYYFALSASLYGQASQRLSEHGLISDQCRVVIEKPIGHSELSAEEINARISQYFTEQQTYRIDHYLGKETVQNLIALRFGNALLERQWDGSSIDHVQISLCETVGVEGRFGYYNHTGALRDMVQNHLLQLLCFVAMEPPSRLDEQSIRQEKIKVLRSLRRITTEKIDRATIRAQYQASAKQPGYCQQLGEQSNTETYVAIKAHIDNWRWSKVPFYLRTGKCLANAYAEIVIQFRPVRYNVFSPSAGPLEANSLVIRLQPEESIKMSLMVKELHSSRNKLKPVSLDLNLATEFTGKLSDGYKTLLLNVVEGDKSLFIHRDEIVAAWQWVDPIIDCWRRNNSPLYSYVSHSEGPAAADALLERGGRQWFPYR
ncbi:Glucose-6-phosphate 1-dehydrogenase [Sinobacterium norvegicum]|uniref:Glucose-6-phosphate 1-dehydrogenase n=1 Tax=Sinobacterium norvegicum TaxID=1641715 RepID=A0ABM9AAX5_9GAMM|nr:glucose-6-phosphate dehydrogenase [Sinobacterium norvegicum]CAH0990353.1 Glucose-6-phosphate 1-dehydrogenase [Sinobacterium norvegicum]